MRNLSMENLSHSTLIKTLLVLYTETCFELTRSFVSFNPKEIESFVEKLELN